VYVFPECEPEADPDPGAEAACNAGSIGKEAEPEPEAAVDVDAEAAMLMKDEAIDPGDIRYSGGLISRFPFLSLVFKSLIPSLA
jgi:hypothetical protein